MPTENQIRDRLVERLEVIEAGLVLVATNYHLRNIEGSSGFVDILARDSTGLFVIIELKKSTSTSREALHEIGKYVDLLGRDKGIPLSRVRAMIVSTEWRELIVPFSYYASRVDFPFDGYELTLETDGIQPAAARRVEPLDPPQGRSLTESQRLINLHAGQTTDGIWQSMSDLLMSYGVYDFVAAKLVSESGEEALAVALGTVWASNIRDQLLPGLLSSGLYEDEDLADTPLEEIVFDHLSLDWRDAALGVCYPDKVGALIFGHGWSIVRWYRSGVFEDESVFPDEEVSDLVQGWTGGLSAGKFQARGRPTNRLQWDEMLRGLDGALSENDSWRRVAAAWMDQVASRSSGFDVAAHVFDPGDFLQTLVHGFDSADLHRLLPEMGAVIEDPVDAVGLIGALAWDGQEVDIIGGLTRTYPTPGTWGSARAFGAVRSLDKDLLSSWHLSYVLWEKKAQEELPKLLRIERNRLVRVAGRENFLGELVYPSVRSISDFFERYEGELRRVVSRLRSTLVVDDTTATQMHFIDNTVPWSW